METIATGLLLGTAFATTGLFVNELYSNVIRPELKDIYKQLTAPEETDVNEQQSHYHNIDKNGSHGSIKKINIADYLKAN